MQRTFFIVLAAVTAVLIGAALPNLGTAQASSILTPSADRTAVVVLAGSVNIAPFGTQTRDDFVRETSPTQAAQVLARLGTGAVWTYNPVVGQFQALSGTTPKVGSAIYVRPSTTSTLQTLSSPSWGKAITAVPWETRLATYEKDHPHRALGKAPNRDKPKSAIKATKVIPKVAPVVHKTTTVTTTVKAAVVVPTKKVVATVDTKTPAKKAKTKAPKPVVQPTATTPVNATPTTVATTPATTTSAGLAAPAGYNASQLIFDDTASGTSINSSLWNTFITAAGSGNVPWNSNGAGGSGVAGSSPNYDAEYDLPGQVAEANGVIDIRATETPTAGILDGSPYTFPFASGVVCTYGKFEFTGGYVQIEAKMPGGDGMWPGLWMLPGSGATGISAGNTYEIDIFEGGGIDGPAGSSTADVYSWHLHTPDGVYGADTMTSTNLTTSYNTYGLKWVPGQSITWYLNGTEVGTVTSADATIPTVPMELIMNLQVANSTASSWHTQYDASTPANSDMLISGVQVYS
jgi:beta-glucanase (GH16 family)